MGLRLRNISKSLAGRPILREVDLDVRAGEAVAILGPNGAGKSTLLRIAAAISPPDTGSIQVGGQPIARDPGASRRAIAYAPQDPALYDELTPAEHVAWWSRLAKVPAAPTVLTDAGLTAGAHRPCAQLSRGQRQRLSLALALLAPAKLIVLDEPFASLDRQGEQWLADRLAAARAHGAAVLVAVHAPSEADRLLARTVRLRERRLEPA